MFAVLSLGWLALLDAQQAQVRSVALDADDIGGVVTSTTGPEGGVWVIAETTDLPTRFRKIVVTDDAGRYLLPDLPRATYNVWVRGYGLVDSKATHATPGQQLNLSAVIAPNARAAAEVYPANYWYSLLEVPGKHEFPGTGPTGNGISPAMTTQAHWINELKEGCQLCHQMGNKITREVSHLPKFDSTTAAWHRRIQSGQRGGIMSGMVARFGGTRVLEHFADWTERIAAGEVPEAPPRPQGVERNVVITQWDWSGPRGYTHDEISTDKRNPRLNANGPVYGVVYGGDLLSIVDPVRHTTRQVKVPTREPAVTVPTQFSQTMPAPSFFWGEEILWTNPAGPHNLMMDQKKRVWMTSRIRAYENPAFCKEGSTNPYAKNFPLAENRMFQATVYDPAADKVSMIDTCFGTHHLQFATDRDNTLFFSGLGSDGVIGWINTRVWDETGDAEKSQGWCPTVVDTNGDGKTGRYAGKSDALDPQLDKHYAGSAYGIIVSPVDGSVWYADPGVPGAIVRLERGSNPPATCRSEVYQPPFANAKAPGVLGYSPRGIDIDTNGVVWTALSGSAQMASFDRRKCAVTSGPTATGQHCPEGWTLYPVPGPQMKGVTEPGSADFHYYNWVDQHNTFGLGRNVPIANGSGSDSLLALQPNGTFVVLRVPYPLGFYTRGLDGRVDDPNAGWKGRGLWANYGTNAVWHNEGGKGTNGALVKFQLRPDPLAK